MTADTDRADAAEAKLVRHGTGTLTLAQLEQELAAIKAYRPPGTTTLRLSNTPGGWSIVATWPLVVPEPERQVRVHAPLLEEDPAITAARIQEARRDASGLRRIRDNPQA